MKPVWVTKYALTRGIIKTSGEVSRWCPPFVRVVWPGALNDRRIFYDYDVAWSEKAALEDAEKLRYKKVAKLEEQFKKIEEQPKKIEERLKKIEDRLKKIREKTWRWIIFEEEPKCSE